MKLSVHHIGGRNGTVPPIDKWRAFWPIIDLTLYDADAAAAEMALKHWQRRKNSCASVVVSSNCVGESEGVSKFHICFDGSASSMLPSDPACSAYSRFTDQRGKGVYNLGEMAESRVIEVTTCTLGALIKTGQIKQPNVLSIDAEGATLQILRGLGDEHFADVVGLFIEAALIPTHLGEAPLYDVLKYLSERGYLCIDFGQSGRFSMAEMHMGAFDRGPYSHIEDAVFLKNPATVTNPETLEKLALVAILCGAVSIAYECFKKLQLHGGAFEWHAPSSNAGLSCLYDFYTTWLSYKDLRLPKFKETFTPELSNHTQYTDEPPSKEIVEAWKAHYLTTIPKYAQTLKKFLELQTRVPTHDSLFEKYSLSEFAAAAKAERLRHIAFVDKTLARIKQGPDS